MSRNGAIGDLAEEYQHRAAQHSRWVCDAWYWRQALLTCARFAAERLRERQARTRVKHGVFGGLHADLVHSMRSLRRNWTSALLLASVLGVGIGAVTTGYGVFHTSLLRPLPYPAAERLVLLRTTHGSQVATPFSLSTPEYKDLAAVPDLFEAIGAIWPGYGERTAVGSEATSGGAFDPTETNRWWGWATRGFFDVLGVSPAQGSLFDGDFDPDAGTRHVILSHEIWQVEFGGRSGIVGESIDVNDAPRVVMGVLPEGFRARSSALRGPKARLGMYIPVPESWWTGRYGQDRQVRWMIVLARLHPGQDIHSAQARLDVIVERWKQADPDYPEDLQISVLDLRSDIMAQYEDLPVVLLVAGALVLALTMTVTSGLCRFAAIDRRQRFVIQAALGARASRLARQQVLESALIAGLGGSLGIALAGWSLGIMRSYPRYALPRADELSLEQTGALLAVLLTLAATAIMALVTLSSLRPELACRAERPARPDALASATPVVSTLALTFPLLVATVLMLMTARQMALVDLGFDPQGTITMSVAVGGAIDSAGRPEFLRQLRSETAALPDVVATALASGHPLMGVDGRGVQRSVRPVPNSGEARSPARTTSILFVDDGYFPSIGARLAAGRGFSASEVQSTARVAVVDAQLADSAWPASSSLGAGVLIGTDPDPYRIIGVVKHVRQDGVVSAELPQVYLPRPPGATGGVYLIARTTRDPYALVPEVERISRRLGNTRSLRRVRSLERYLDDATGPTALLASLVTSLGLSALGLSSVAVYALFARYVAATRFDMAIRLTVGARPAQVRLAILARCLAVLAAGVAMGLVLAVAGSGLLRSQVYGVSVGEPTAFAVGIVALVAGGLVATYGPARRAADTDPAVVLRGQ